MKCLARNSVILLQIILPKVDFSQKENRYPPVIKDLFNKEL